MRRMKVRKSIPICLCILLAAWAIGGGWGIASVAIAIGLAALQSFIHRKQIVCNKSIYVLAALFSIFMIIGSYIEETVSYRFVHFLFLGIGYFYFFNLI